MIDQRLWHEARTRPGLILVTVLLHGSLGAVTVSQAYLLSRIVAGVFLQGNSRGQMHTALLFLFLLAVLRALATTGADLAAGRVALDIKTDLSRRLFAHLFRLGPVRSSGERTGELSAALTSGVEALESYFSQYLPQLAIAVVVPVTILATVFPVDPLTGIVLLVTAPLIPVFMVLIGRFAAELTGRQWRALSLMSAHFLDVLQGLTTLKQLGRSRAQVENVAQISDRYRRTTLTVLRVTFLSALALELVATLSVAIVAVEIALRLLRGGLAFADALFILVLAPEFYQPLRQLGLRYHAGMEGVSAATRIFGLLETEAPLAGQGVPVPHGPLTIEFRKVRAAYETRQPALNGVSFTLRPGSQVTLTGRSGAGKSTILRLLLGFLAPSSGEILVNGRSLHTLDPHEWRRKIAWVPQQPFLFNDSIAANIRLARPDATTAQVEAAARLARAHSFISALPHGYDTNIGEHGTRLSGGEAQRLALARAFLQDAPILLLDEPAAQLDPRTEAELQETTHRLLRGRTALVIAHRAATIAGANEIIRLEAGEIVPATFASEPAPSPPIAAGYGRSGAAEEAAARPTRGVVPGASADTTATLTALIHLLRMLAQSWRQLLLAIALGVLAIGSNVSLLGLSAYLISAAALQPSIADLSVAIVGVRFFGLSRALFRYLERLAAHDLTFRLLARWRVWFYAALEPLAPARLQQYRSGDLLSRIIGDVASLEHFYVRGLGPPLVAFVVSTGLLIVFARFHWSLAVALSLFLLFAGLILPLASLMVARGPGQQLMAKRAALEALVVDGVQGMADLLAAGQASAWERRIASAAARVAGEQRHLNALSAQLNGLAVLANQLAVWMILWLAIRLVVDGVIAGVYLAALALATSAIFEAVQPLPLAAQQLSQSLASAKRLLAIIEAPPAVEPPVHPLPVPEHRHLSVRDLTFSYQPGQPAALQGVSFDLPQGKWMAVIGPSGAGKSTLISLLLRFWDIPPGSILLDGQDVRNFDPDTVRVLCGVIAQQPYLFNASLRDNIRLARPDAGETEIETAANVAQLAGFVAALPQGYETPTGERGLQLSGGQRQRVAIARAILQDAPILILDEPTAHLDPETEAALLATVFSSARGRSLLLATHRLLGMEEMDEIVVLDRGRIVERGSHKQLLAARGLYAALWRSQERLAPLA